MDGDVDAAIEYMIAERLAVSTDDAEVDPYMDYACNGKYLKLSWLLRHYKCSCLSMILFQ